MRKRRDTPSSLELSSESPPLSAVNFRSERKAIQRLSGDHLGWSSWPDCVNWMSELPLASSWYSHKSWRKICWSQSARSATSATELPSGEISTAGKLTELKNSSTVNLGFWGKATGAGG